MDNKRPTFDLDARVTASRRTVLKGALVGGAFLAFPTLLVACGNDNDNDSKGSSGGKAKSKELEIFSWWTGGGEAAGLDAMIAIWKREHPDIKFVNAAVAGGAGSNAKAVLAQRLSANDPPDSFQGHAGAELSDYIKAGQILALNDYYDKWGLNDVFPADLIEQISVNGKIYSVPVNIHRANVLWFSPSVLQAAGVSGAPDTVDDFLAALEKVKASGKTPLSLAEQWTVEHLMETIFIATLGVEGWSALWKPAGDWKSSQVEGALTNFKKVLEYANSDYASLTWQDAAKQVVEGKAGFNVMGDWAAGYFIELKKTAKKDYDWAPVPGTDGVYDWLSDSFTLPKGAPHSDATVLWLELCGSKEGQDAFNPVKGSIPARKDADASKYGEYLKWALEQWKTSKLAGSLAHGVVANNAWKTDVDGALGLFLSSKDIGKFQAALATAHDTYAKA